MGDIAVKQPLFDFVLGQLLFSQVPPGVKSCFIVQRQAWLVDRTCQARS